MGYLSKITAFINDQLKERSFKDKRFAGARFFPIASIIPGTTKKGKPSLQLVSLNEAGETLCDDLIYTDSEPMRLFHVVRDSIWQESKDDFGHHINSKRITSISLILFATRKLKIDPDDLELFLKFGLPYDLISVSGYGAVKIILEKTDYNQKQIFAEEFLIDNYTLEPDAVLIRLKYKLEVVVSPDCLKLICC